MSANVVHFLSLLVEIKEFSFSGIIVFCVHSAQHHNNPHVKLCAAHIMVRGALSMALDALRLGAA
ncbi:MAG: hypothetical protein ACRCZO_01535, partial [Cetobacterium sp.]